MSETKQPMVTSATEWRKAREQGEITELPSGKVAALRPLSLLGLVKRGSIPDPLSQLVTEMIAGEEKVVVNLELFQSFGELLDLICIVAFVNPKIVDNPQADDEISVEDLDFDDQLFVFNLVQSEVNLTKPFRPEPPGDVETLSDQSGVEDASVGPDGD